MARKQNAGGRDAIQMLTEDHRRAEKLFAEFSDVDREDEDALTELVETACMELQLHAMLEEEIFYAAVRAQSEDRELQDLLNQAEVEHEATHELIAKLQELDADDDMYGSYFAVLARYMHYHVQEEEEQLFPAVRKLPGLDLNQLAEDMKLRREELLAELESEDEEEVEDAAEPDDDTVASVDEELEDEEEQIAPTRRH